MPSLVGPNLPPHHSHTEINWPAYLKQIPADGNWYVIDDVEFDNYAHVRLSYHRLRAIPGFEVRMRRKMIHVRRVVAG